MLPMKPEEQFASEKKLTGWQKQIKHLHIIVTNSGIERLAIATGAIGSKPLQSLPVSVQVMFSSVNKSGKKD
jgi:hypothetical protein